MIEPRFNKNLIWGISRIVVIIAVFSPAIAHYLFHQSAPPGFAAAGGSIGVSPATETAVYKEAFVSDAESDSVMVHSAAITEMPDHQLRSVWFQGSKEGSLDVALYTSVLDNATGRWSTPTVLVDREQASVDIGRRLKSIGNAVIYSDKSGRTWLFFVTGSLFGWSGADTNFIYSDDSGKTWSPAKRLQLSPVPHSGTLVKGMPFEYADGTIGLPVFRSYDQYSFAELVRVDRNGEVLSRVTMSNGERGALQPSVITLDDQTAVAFMRYNGDDPKRILRTTTSNAGRSWTSPAKLDLPNPDSALASLRLSDGSIILVFNNSTQYRNVLTLAISTDLGINWKIIHTFESDEAVSSKSVNDERSYPSLLKTSAGEIQLLYTWKRRKIRHIVFNEAWVRSLND